MSDIIDIDPALRALDALAADFAEPGPPAAACEQAWPLFAAPTDELSPLDLDARDRHLARCARCRVAFAEDALDPSAAVPARAEVLPVATVLPARPARPARPFRRRVAFGLGAALFTAAAGAAGVSITLHSRKHATPDLNMGVPVDLVVIVDRGALNPFAVTPFSAAIRDIAASLPIASRVTITVASGDKLDVVWRTFAEDRSVLPDLDLRLTVDPQATAAHYAPALDAADALLDWPGTPRAVLVIGNLCGASGPEVGAALARLSAHGVAVRGAAFRAPSAACGPVANSLPTLVIDRDSALERLTVAAADQLVLDSGDAFVHHPPAPHDR